MSRSIYSTCSKLALGWLLLVAQCGSSSACSSSNSSFEYEVQAGEDGETGDNFMIYWTPDDAAGTIAFQVVYGGQGYISIGFSANGGMVGSDAVVGLPGDNSSVQEYNLISKSPGGQQIYDTQEITSTSVAQNGSTTTMGFTRPFDPSDDSKEVLSTVPGELTYLIWAYGSSNEFMFHEGWGSIELDLFCGVGSTTEDGSSNPTPAPASTSPAPTAVPLGTTSAPTDSATTVGVVPAPTPAVTGSPTVAVETATPSTTIAPTTSVQSGSMTPTPEPGETKSPSISASTSTFSPSPAPTSADTPGTPASGATQSPIASLSPTNSPIGDQASTTSPPTDAATSGAWKLGAGGWIDFLKAGIVAFLTSRVLAR